MSFGSIVDARRAKLAFPILMERWGLRAFSCFLVLLLFAAGGAVRAAQLPLERVANETLRFPTGGSTQAGYQLENIFGTLSFVQPVGVFAPPYETNRLFVIEKHGRIIVINDLRAPYARSFLDISSRVDSTGEAGLLGMAFNPRYGVNRYFYLFYSVRTNSAAGTGLHQRVSRFQTSKLDPDVALPESELPLITQYDEEDLYHNAGCLQFGPEGYLYVGLGDTLDTNAVQQSSGSQRIDGNFASGIIRIDVDKRVANRLPNPHPASTTNYFIPADNPFVGATNFNGKPVDPANVRTEFFAVGLRHPWRFSFDSLTGDLYCGEVGWNIFEEVNLIRKGANYGWAYYEATQEVRPGAPADFAPVAPLHSYPHGAAPTYGSAVIGGVVYRGARFPALYGAYVFGDWEGSIWALRSEGTNVAKELLTFAGGQLPCGFGVDPRNQDVLVVTLNGGHIKRLTYHSNVVEIVPALSLTGVFEDLATLKPSPGVVPFDVNVPFWSDHALKRRWFSVPDTNAFIDFKGAANWIFPTGTVWIKHFDLEEVRGNPATARRLETRVLVHASSGLYGLTYRWQPLLSDATLVNAAGSNETFSVVDNGTVRTQVWHFPSRAECLTCHTPSGGLALGFNTAQLNRTVKYGDMTAHQLEALSAAGYFSSPGLTEQTLPALVAATNTNYSLEYRVRSYLAANCVQCHQPGGVSRGRWDARLSNPLSATGLINGLLQDFIGDPTNRVVVPGDPTHSVLLKRISTMGPLHMPPLATSELDRENVELVRDWIVSGLTNYQTYARWQLEHFGSTNALHSGAAEDFDNDGSLNQEEYLLSTDPNSASNFWKVATSLMGDDIEIRFTQTALRGFEVMTTTNLTSPIRWELHMGLQNPYLSAPSSREVVIREPTAAARGKFYRVRPFEP